MPTPVSTFAQYRLAEHVRACHVDDQVILLDLHRGKYMGIGGPYLRAMSQAVVDWPVGDAIPRSAEEETDVSPWVAKLLDQSMLASSSEMPAQRTVLDAAVDSLNAEAIPVPYDWRRLARLCWAAGASAYSLRRLSLASIARGITHMQRAALRRENQPEPNELRHAVATYTRMRPFVFTAHDRCLYDSLTLMRFLAAEGIAATWVIGVRTRPFGAHSWVQGGGLVLNDLHEHVNAFTPILVV